MRFEKIVCCMYSLCLIFFGTMFSHVALHIHRQSLASELRAVMNMLSTTRIVFVEHASLLQIYEVSVPDLPRLDRLILGTLAVLAENATVDILRGANTVLKADNASLYRWIKAMDQSYVRASSHPSTCPALSVPDLFGKGSLLTGVTSRDDSWFQLEADMWGRSPRSSLLHALNYIFYRMTDVQVGPYGTSVHTDRRPIILSYS